VTRLERIQDKLTKGLATVHLVVENESHMHSVPKGSETHFKVLVVSPMFEGLGAVERHRRVHGILSDELRSGLHALTLRALTPAQWEAEGAAGFQSPACLGGSKHEAKS
jgi:stress-induced morphogen